MSMTEQNTDRKTDHIITRRIGIHSSEEEMETAVLR